MSCWSGDTSVKRVLLESPGWGDYFGVGHVTVGVLHG